MFDLFEMFFCGCAHHWNPQREAENDFNIFGFILLIGLIYLVVFTFQHPDWVSTLKIQ